MNYLICETSTLLGSVAVLRADQKIFDLSHFRQGSHSDRLNVMIQDVLQQSHLTLNDIDCFVSGVGPGSFTGIRIALNTIKTLAYSFHKPVLGLNTLFSLGYQFNQQLQSSDQQNLKSDRITVVLNAYKNMVYLAQYQINLSSTDLLIETINPQVVRVQNLSTLITKPTYIIGDGFIDYKPYLEKNFSDLFIHPEQDSTFDFPQSKSIAYMISKNLSHFSKTHWSELIPEYLRASEAEENKLGIIYQPL